MKDRKRLASGYMGVVDFQGVGLRLLVAREWTHVAWACYNFTLDSDEINCC
jgi:hypothetical protein